MISITHDVHVTCSYATPLIRDVQFSALSMNYRRMTDATKLMRQGEMGARLRNVREALGRAQAEFALAVGVADNTVAAWENGRNMLDAVHLATLAERFAFTADYVISNKSGTLSGELGAKVQALMVSSAARPTAPATPKQSRRKRGRPFPQPTAPHTLHELPTPFWKP